MGSISLAMSQDKLRHILEATAPGRPLFPELDEARADVEGMKARRAAQILLGEAHTLLDDLYPIPETTYSLYREFRRSGKRYPYEEPYFQKRTNLTAAALALLAGHEEMLDAVQDYIWDICEETNWVLPAHEGPDENKMGIDLFAAETGFFLAELITHFEDVLSPEIVERVKDEIEVRIFQDYLARGDTYGWYQTEMNWNGVCNSSVGNAFLLLEADIDRLAEALAMVLKGLETYLEGGFESDGGSTEGVGYWSYGLKNMICFSEMLRQRTEGEIDILSSVDKLKKIAVYPLKVMLSPGRFANFSDSDELTVFAPGVVTRLAERTEQPEALKVLAGSGAQTTLPWRLPMALRTMLWWDGTPPVDVSITDAQLPEIGVARLVTETPGGAPVVVAFKAGHNGENHNQNDVGTFIVHVDGESFLCDPGRGLYSRQYFSDARYENVFANSYGHSVPVIDGQLQAAGREYEGKVRAFEPQTEPKQVVSDIAGAYPVDALTGVGRTLALAAEGERAGEVTVTDVFDFDGEPGAVQGAFVTWLDVEVDGGTATLHGAVWDLELTVEAPSGAAFELEALEEESEANRKGGILKRLAVDLDPQLQSEVKVKAVVRTRS